MHIKNRIKKQLCLLIVSAMVLTGCVPIPIGRADVRRADTAASDRAAAGGDDRQSQPGTEQSAGSDGVSQSEQPKSVQSAEPDIIYMDKAGAADGWDGKTKHDAYVGTGYKVVFEIRDSWKGGFTGNVTIVNTGNKPLKNWALKFSYKGKISNVWNADVKKTADGEYTAKNVDWNKDIEPGKSVEFGMSEQTDFAGFPTGYQLIVEADSGEGTSSLPSTPDPDATWEPVSTQAPGSDPGATSSPGEGGQDATGVDTDDEDVTGAVVSGTVKKHGRLKVRGRFIVDKNGKKFLIKGPSTHGIAWFPDFVNKSAFKTCKKWGANTVRLACYSSEGEGYNTTTCWKTIDRGVKAATELGMYVIIDWHILNENKPMMSYDRAKAFFKHFAKKYGKRKNIIWEICNEPNGCTWGDIKPYAKKIIPLIRKFSKNIIVVGTPTWSQDVDVVAGDRLNGKYKKNVCYTLHFYAATHKDDLRNRVKTAISKGLPILCTEFSICEASGAGTLDKSSGNAWISLFRKHGIGYVSWSLCNKDEAASLIRSDCQKTGGWKKSDLSETGKWVIKKWK